MAVDEVCGGYGMNVREEEERRETCKKMLVYMHEKKKKKKRGREIQWLVRRIKGV